MKFKFRPTPNTKQYSKSKRALSTIKFIVIHDTGNTGKGANALAHQNYLKTASRYGSAHYFVDDSEIIQLVADSRIAWSVGDHQGYGRYLNGCTNANSISIELCINSDSDKEKAYKNLLELTKNLMKKFNVDIEHVCRHFDVSRKRCPGSMSANNWHKWWVFKEQLRLPIEYIIDLDKDSDFGTKFYNPVNPVVVNDVENLAEQDELRKEYLQMNGELEKAKKYLRENGISDGLNPDKPATRAELFVMLYRASLPKEERPDFSKVYDK